MLRLFQCEFGRLSGHLLHVGIRSGKQFDKNVNQRSQHGSCVNLVHHNLSVREGEDEAVLLRQVLHHQIGVQSESHGSRSLCRVQLERLLGVHLLGG